MAGTRYTYQLSKAADNDLQEIYAYTALNFGFDQSAKYLSGLEELLFALCSNPQLGRGRNEIKEGLRSVSYVSHTVFYRVVAHHIRVVRVLHASRDIPKFL